MFTILTVEEVRPGMGLYRKACWSGYVLATTRHLAFERAMAHVRSDMEVVSPVQGGLVTVFFYCEPE